ncbi:MAG: suppressor of fused domain protein [Moraxella sp.]|nr:suppressor of fused domain protein [Moraxella sp.]
MIESQILAKINEWDEEDDFIAIVDYVDYLPKEQHTPKVLSEQARALNNIYWQHKIPSNLVYLERAVQLLQRIKEEVGADQHWHYRIGYAYFYLNNLAQARHHLMQAGDVNNAMLLLLHLDIAQSKGISVLEVESGEVGFLLELMTNLLADKAAAVSASFLPPVEEAVLVQLEQTLGISLPDEFRQLYRAFDGQKAGAYFSNFLPHRFLRLEDRTDWQALVAHLKRYYGDDWQSVALDDEFWDEEIKRGGLNPLWMPFAINEPTEDDPKTTLLCLDLDPAPSGKAGQVIAIEWSKDEAKPLISVMGELSGLIGAVVQMLKADELVYDKEQARLVYVDDEAMEGDFQGVPSYYTDEEIEALEAYIEDNFGQIDRVLHELVSFDIHCDIYIIKPTAQTPYYTLVTGGMGAYAMNVPPDYMDEHFCHAELMIRLPETWQIDSDDEQYGWAIHWLKQLARYPLHYDTYLGHGHTIPIGEQLKGTEFECFLLIDSDDKEGNQALVQLPTGKEVAFYSLVPLYTQEMNFKLDYGTYELMQRFERAEIAYPPVVDVRRLNTCAGYQVQPNTEALAGVLWVFDGQVYETLMQFWEVVRAYNQALGNSLEEFQPFSHLLAIPKVAVCYSVARLDEGELHEHEVLAIETNDDGDSEIIATITGHDGAHIGALELLWQLHNSMANKQLGEYVYFGGLEPVSADEYNWQEPIPLLCVYQSH